MKESKAQRTLRRERNCWLGRSLDAPSERMSPAARARAWIRNRKLGGK